jgi:hypothetical protein
MTNRTYRLLLGIAILLILYFDLTLAMYGLIGVLFIEGLTNWRIPLLVNRILQRPAEQREPRANKWPPQAEQAWRLLIGAMLLLTAVVFKDVVWFMPWFLCVPGCSACARWVAAFEQTAGRSSGTGG